MDSSGLLLALLALALLTVTTKSQGSPEVSDEDQNQNQDQDQNPDRDLIEALEALLGRINRISSPEKRGSIPLCGMGDRCAMKFGPRIGKLCDCRRGANCNSYLLKCI